MVQDYWYLNEWTVKNNYPLPLILYIIKNIRTKVFIKLDLRQGYDNVRIKKENKWKAAFTIPEGLFEPKNIIFGLKNLPSILQTIMNELLRDLINSRKVEIFIDNVMVGTESKEEHDELVEEILRRMEENDFYVKPENCKQQVRKVDFLGVVIRLEGIRIEEEKVKAVLDQPVSKSIKDIQKFLGLENYYRRFVNFFVKIARPLHKLIRKKQIQEREIRQEKSFEALKEIHNGISHTIFGQKDENGGECIGLCYRRSIVNRVQ